MKILLFGEFSGLHKNLKEGLEKLGHKVVIAAGQDGFKKIDSDINLDPILTGFPGQIEARLKPFLNLYRLRGYDVVQIVSPFFPNAKLFPKEFFYWLLRKLNKKFFILGAGSDAYFWKNGRSNMKYSPFDDWLYYDLKTNYYYMQEEKAFLYNRRIVNTSDGIIPVMYEYESCYAESSKRLNTIPLPINTENIDFSENMIKEKLVVFHGLNRYGFKGTRHVEEAFRELNKMYPDELELIIDGKMPLEDYLRVMQKSNVVIDQVNSYSLGMNGLYALAMGKVVIGGAEQEGLNSLGIKSSPVINVEPNKDSIISAIEMVLSKKDKLKEMGFESRDFVKKFHCNIKVAKKYLYTWNNN